MTNLQPFRIDVDPRKADEDGKVAERRFSVTSFEPVDAIRQVLSGVRGIKCLRLLTQPFATKLFIVLADDDLARDFSIVKRMVQLEDIKPSLDLSYDLVPADAEHFVPPDAVAIL